MAGYRGKEAREESAGEGGGCHGGYDDGAEDYRNEPFAEELRERRAPSREEEEQALALLATALEGALELLRLGREEGCFAKRCSSDLIGTNQRERIGWRPFNEPCQYRKDYPLQRRAGAARVEVLVLHRPELDFLSA
ncbi:hypothetical protein ABZP36_029325 [Zizania latifolia]